MRQQYIVGNWKMNHGFEEIKNFFALFSAYKGKFNCKAWIAPQFLHIAAMRDLAMDVPTLKIGAQNCCYEDSGAFTGEISPKSLHEIDAQFVILGHSERRSLFNETNDTINKKVKAALSSDLKVILCVGETLEENESGKAKEVIESQLSESLKQVTSDHNNIIVAYEPVWAIGTGKTATPEYADQIHKIIRDFFKVSRIMDHEKTSILYGGSVKTDNIEGLLSKENIDGALVGGASLDGESFLKLCLACK